MGLDSLAWLDIPGDDRRFSRFRDDRPYRLIVRRLHECMGMEKTAASHGKSLA
jgi:hypothetical protein